jgi:Holliday junction resolvase RusA-like endonuclease
MENQNQLGNNVNGYMLMMGNHPPKKSITIRLHISIILLYSARKKNANVNDEYST